MTRPFVHPRVESVLTSRFILSLRMHDRKPDEALELGTLPGTYQDSAPHVSMLAFDQMAGPLEFELGDEEEEEGRGRGRGRSYHRR